MGKRRRPVPVAEDDVSEETRIEAANRALLVEGDDTIVECRDHNVKMRYGDLDPVSQIALLNGLDLRGDKCILTPRRDRDAKATT